MKRVRLLALVALFAPAVAGAYARTTVPGTKVCLHLPERTVSWAAASPLGADLPDELALAALRRSFAVWEAERCSDLAFIEGPRCSPVVGFETRGENTTTVVFRRGRCREVVPSGDPCWREESCANDYGCWDGDDRQIAITTTTFSSCSGVILDSDIEFNAAGYRFTVVDGPPCGASSAGDCVDTDLENTLVHEIGHVIGLDHSSDRDATMYASAPGGETKKRDLGKDDREAICAIYPAGGATAICEPAASCPPLRSGGSASGCGAAGSGPAAAGCAAVAAVALALRIRRRR